MNELKTSTGNILVHLVRGEARRTTTYHRGRPSRISCVSKTSRAHYAVFINGVPPDETVPLDEAAVTIVPRSTDTGAANLDGATIAAFQDEALYREYSDVLNARRREVDSDEESQDG